MRSHHPWVGAVLILVSMACESPPAEDGSGAAPADTPSAADRPMADSEDVRAVTDRWLAAWNAADTATLGSIVAEDVVLLQPDGPVLEGRDAILDMIAGAYDVTAYQQSATVDEVLMPGEHAYARGSWTVAPTGEAEGETFDGKWSALFRRGPDGGWQLWRWMWNQPSDQAPTAGS